MNEIMVPNQLGKNFSFSKPKFNDIPSPTKSKELKPGITVFGEKTAFIKNCKMDISDEKNLQSTVSESNLKNSVVCNSHDTFSKMTENAEIQDTVSSALESDSSSTEYEIVSLNVENLTKTTVINTTYNLISQSTVRDTGEKELVSSMQSTRSPFILSNSIDKSRVVVQVLTSDANNCVESQTVIENQNSCAKVPKKCTFRDDVFKLFSNTQPAHINKNNNNKVVQVDNALSVKKGNFRDDVFKLFSKAKPKKLKQNSNKLIKKPLNADKSSTEISSNFENSSVLKRRRRKPTLKFFFRNGKGSKLYEITYAATNLKHASARLLRILHYVLFDSYGPCSTGLQLLQTKRNILRFCGYPFKKNSETFQKKMNCLIRLPFPILSEMYKAVIGIDVLSRTEMVTKLLTFFMKPQELNTEEEHLEAPSREEYVSLIEIASKGPLPAVMVKNLTEDDIGKLQNQMKFDQKVETDPPGSVSDSSSYFLPAYILKGPGAKLKSFPKITGHVLQAKDRIIKILHYLLYGRVEHVEKCRPNILEFSGFLPCQKKFKGQGLAMLNKMGRLELLQLCNILCLHAKTNSRSQKIKKILKYLSAPCDPLEPKKGEKMARPRLFSSVGKYTIMINKLDSNERDTDSNYKSLLYYANLTCELAVFKSFSVFCACHMPLMKISDDDHVICAFLKRPKENDCPILTARLKYEKPCHPKKIENATGPRLRDFRNVCFNIECASPSDLTELNDLLFIKPCDESEIHQRILDFERFEFPVNSMDYHYRKTLMHYMSFCIIKKIAQLLDIENWDKVPSQDDLSSSILTFLMEMNLPGSYSQKVPTSKSVMQTKTTHNSELPENSKSQVVQIYEKKTEESWCFQSNEKSSLDQNVSSGNLHSAKEDFSSQPQKKTVAGKRVIIHRLSKAAVQTENTAVERNDLPNCSTTDENAIPLRALLHHPSDQELKQIIGNIIQKDVWSITMGDLIQKVYHCYPNFNLAYRENFIKTEARQILAQLRSNAVKTLKSMQYNDFM